MCSLVAGQTAISFMNTQSGQHVAVIGGGWAGMAAAVQATQRGHRVTVFEAARQLGGRARAVPLRLPDGRSVTVDNGQHILIGAYTECLRLMRQVGVTPGEALLRLPLALTTPDGNGLRLPAWPAPWDALAGIASARGWPWRDKAALLRAALAWRAAGFRCAPEVSVAELCRRLPERLIHEFIEPLCVSALNTPVQQASAQVFLRVLHDGLLGAPGGSNLLLPRTDLGTLLPEPAAAWVAARGGAVRLGERVDALRRTPTGWRVGNERFDQVVLATPPAASATLVAGAAEDAHPEIAGALRTWAATAAALPHQAITTIYAQANAPAPGQALLRAPMLALRNGPSAPAQFVFERDVITPNPPPTHLLAFVISASTGERPSLQAAIAAQAQAQLGLQVVPLLAVSEKRATFACTPGLRRPAARIAPGLHACGDHIDGPYPATLEGAVRSGLQAADALG